MNEALEAARKGQGTADDFVDAASRFEEEEKAVGAALSEVLGLSMSSRVDGTGAYYGNWDNGDFSAGVYVYPPKDVWNGVHEPIALRLHDTDWQLTVAGKKVAQASMIKDLPALKSLTLADE